MPYNPVLHTMTTAETQADLLFHAGKGRKGTDEAAFLKILLGNPPEHLVHINTICNKKYDKSLAQLVGSEFSGDAKKALLCFGGWMLALILNEAIVLIDVCVAYITQLGSCSSHESTSSSYSKAP